MLHDCAGPAVLVTMFSISEVVPASRKNLPRQSRFLRQPLNRLNIATFWSLAVSHLAPRRESMVEDQVNLERMLPTSACEIVAATGELIATTKAAILPENIVVFDTKIAINVGDEVRRKLPSGQDEV